MAIPILMILVAFAAGVLAGTFRLPTPADRRSASVVSQGTAGLVGIAFALVGGHVDEIVRQLQSASASAGGVGGARADIVAAGLVDLMRDLGPVLGLWVAVVALFRMSVSQSLPPSLLELGA